MKKVIAILLSLVTLTSMSACNNKSGRSDNISLYEQVQTTEPTKASEPTKLTNKMTENELQLVDKHGLTLLDEVEKPSADPNAEHKVSIEFVKGDTETTRKYLDENRDMFTDEEYDHELRKLQKREGKGDEDLFPSAVLVDGFILSWLIPAEDDFYDGGSYWFITSQPDENGEPETVKESFKSFEEYLEYVRDRETEWGYSEELVDTEIIYMQLAYDALKSGDYETLPEGTVDRRDESASLWDAFNNYRSDW